MESIEKKYISLDEQKAILLEIMDEIHEFCVKNEIKYFLLAGSLIGSVRHKGFIPWDDDIDICMLREDYEKFLKLWRQSNNKRFQLMSLDTNDSYHYAFAKIVDNRTVLIEEIDHAEELGIYVDVFPLDYCGETEEEAQKNLRKIRAYIWLRNIKVIKYSKKRVWWKNLILLLGKILVLCVSTRKVAEMISKKAKRGLYVNSAYVMEAVGNVYGNREIWPIECFQCAIDGDFEGRKYKIPQGYDEVLERTYGDYMQLPPEEKRITHHASVMYWRE